MCVRPTVSARALKMPILARHYSYATLYGLQKPYGIFFITKLIVYDENRIPLFHWTPNLQDFIAYLAHGNQKDLDLGTPPPKNLCHNALTLFTGENCFRVYTLLFTFLYTRSLKIHY